MHEECGALVTRFVKLIISIKKNSKPFPVQYPQLVNFFSEKWKGAVVFRNFAKILSLRGFLFFSLFHELTKFKMTFYIWIC